MGQTNQIDIELRGLFKTTLTVSASLGLLLIAPKAGAEDNDRASIDAPATHNMLVFGEKTVYLSHLPMFDGLNEKKTDYTSPHRYQVILEATFTDGNKDLTGIYVADRQTNPSVKMYTLNPARFVLPALDPSQTAPLQKFSGNTIFRGHLERGGQPFIGFADSGREPPANGVFDVSVKRIIDFHKFDPKAFKHGSPKYLLFGKGQELFMSHYIEHPPDYDQILSVRISYPFSKRFTDEQLNRGVQGFLERNGDTSAQRLKEKEKIAGGFYKPRPDGSGEAVAITIEVLRELYFEEGELFIPPTFEQTEEEKKSGF